MKNIVIIIYLSSHKSLPVISKIISELCHSTKEMYFDYLRFIFYIAEVYHINPCASYIHLMKHTQFI